MSKLKNDRNISVSAIKSLIKFGAFNNWDEIAKDPSLLRILAFLLNGNKHSIYHEEAREILKENFWGVGECEGLLMRKFTHEEILKVTEFPWNKDVLNSPCRFNFGKKVYETHFAFLGVERIFPQELLTIMEWLKTYHLVKSPLWFKDEEFANQKTCELRWHLLPIVQPLRGEGLNYPDQKSLIPAEYEMASAIEEITKIILMKKKFGAFQTPENLHRTNDTIQCGQRIAVGGINLFEITSFWDSDEKEKLGVALSRKPYI